jgi:hypothetical protein
MLRWVVALIAVSGVPSPIGSFGAASVQACNTACQSAFTDCVLACDGSRPCEQRCQSAVEHCVAGCAKQEGARK